MRTFLFICTGNTCRSPMAAAIMTAKQLPVTVKSAGIYADGSPYSHQSVEVMAEIGIDIAGGTSVKLNGQLLCDSTDIFCMSKSHEELLYSAGVPRDRITVLDVCDPFGGDIGVYRRCRDELTKKLSCFDFNIRDYRGEDSDGIAAIEKVSFSVPWTKSSIEDSANSGVKFLTAENGYGIVCGFGGMQLAADEAYVTNIAVLPAYRQLGLGTKLLLKMIDFCRNGGYSFLSLEVRKSNTDAIRIYEQNGFKTVGTRKNFYTLPREDALIMTRMMTNENIGD